MDDQNVDFQSVYGCMRPTTLWVIAWEWPFLQMNRFDMSIQLLTGKKLLGATGFLAWEWPFLIVYFLDMLIQVALTSEGFSTVITLTNKTLLVQMNLINMTFQFCTGEKLLGATCFLAWEWPFLIMLSLDMLIQVALTSEGFCTVITLTNKTLLVQMNFINMTIQICTGETLLGATCFLAWEWPFLIVYLPDMSIQAAPMIEGFSTVINLTKKTLLQMTFIDMICNFSTRSFLGSSLARDI
jgi:hypothetical protein